MEERGTNDEIDDDGVSGFEKRSLIGSKLRRGCTFKATRGGPRTPMPSWKLDPGSSPPPAAVSARKLGANLWEIQEELLPLRGMSRRSSAAQRSNLPVTCPTPVDRTRMASGSSGHEGVRRRRAKIPVSPAYSSSVEVSLLNQATIPSSSLDFRDQTESRFRITTSPELLKVLNRIWSLEEQHISSVSLVKSLKLELEDARHCIEELVQEQRVNRREIDNLVEQVVGAKVVRKSKELERIKSEIRSVRDEVEDEKRLRKHFECLHRKLGKELFEIKSAYVKAVGVLERRNKNSIMLEELCDDLAQGIVEYEEELPELRRKSGMDGDEKLDSFVLHLSKAWLDARLHLKNASEREFVVDRLYGELRKFLDRTRSGNPKDFVDDLRQVSLESIHMNGTVSAASIRM